MKRPQLGDLSRWGLLRQPVTRQEVREMECYQMMQCITTFVMRN